MLSFCNEIDDNHDTYEKYQRKVRSIATWFEKSVNRYRAMLKTEVGIERMIQELTSDTVDEEVLSELSRDLLDDFDYANGAKMAYFQMSDALIKLILSKYSYGPGTGDSFLINHGISANLKFSDGENSWISCKADASIMTEIVSKVLRDENIKFPIDFVTLNMDRSARGKFTHQLSPSICFSAMRCYNIIREMLVFLDDDYRDTLPSFTFDEMFRYDCLLSEPCQFSFDNSTTILIVDSVHDVQKDYREAVANLPWDLVIDFDGYSDYGGLQSAVTHNRVQKEVLYLSVANNSTQLPVGYTLWYRCGEYASPDFVAGYDGFKIEEFVHFHKGCSRTSKRDKANNLQNILEKLLLKAKERDKIINIVALSDNAPLVESIVRAINNDNVSLDDYFLTWVGLSETTAISALYYDDYDTMNEHFAHQSCPVNQFFQAFYEHSAYWMPRKSIESSFSLPSSSGTVCLSENERNNIENDFVALYDHCEQESQEQSDALRRSFYSGNIASWNTIANDYALRLRKPADYERMKQTIKTLLGQIQSDAQKRLFFIQHTPGIGGSTIARQLAWDLHNEYAVLEVRRYSKESFKTKIEHLYDVVLNKAPVIIYAEDTIPFFRNICEDICTLNRRCIMIAACRFGSSILQDYPNACREVITSIQDPSIPRLQDRYRQNSDLPAEIIKSKDEKFNKEIQGSMLTPFIIGLYYMEKDFSIDNYVRKSLEGCNESRYADMLACMAMCDRFDVKYIPTSFVNRVLGLNLRKDFLRLVPAAASIVTNVRQSSGVDYYHFKHPLLSNRFLEIYCERYYAGVENLRNALYNLSFKLIDQISEMRLENSADYLNILISILIQNKKADLNNQYLSSLMQEIAIPENQRLLMQHLAERFRPIADVIREKTKDENRTDDRVYRGEQIVLRLVSHSYAHLGRMYSKDAKNHQKAYESFRQAIDYMPDDDPNIYHMAGNALFDKLQQCWEDGTTPQIGKDEIKQIVDQACSYFEDSIRYGSPEYGYPSKLKLLYRYLKYIYKENGISSEVDVKLLDSQTRIYQSEFINTLEEAKAYPDFGEYANDTIFDYENRFRSQIMFGNYSKAIEYYQNKVDTLRTSGDLVGYAKALKSLVFTQVSQARSKNPNTLFCYNIKNPQMMKENVEILLDQPYNEDSYSEYSIRSQMFRYWMQLAKILNVSVEQGIVMVKRWLDMEQRQRYNINPEPYYYYRILLYLSAKAGSSFSISEVHDLENRISHIEAEELFDPRRGNLTKIRDVFVNGREMGQLMDVSYCHTDEEINESIALTKQMPIPIYARFEESLNRGIAILQIYNPSEWNGEKVRMDIGRRSQSSITTAQTGHKIAFIMGFSVRFPVVLPGKSADIDAGETLDISGFSSEKHLNKNQQKETQVNRNGNFASKERSAESRIDKDINLDAPQVANVSLSKKEIRPSEQVVEAEHETRELPVVKNGASVKVKIIASDNDVATGIFKNGGKSCCVSITLKGKKDTEQVKSAMKQGKEIIVRIVSHKDDVYTGKIM